VLSENTTPFNKKIAILVFSSSISTIIFTAGLSIGKPTLIAFATGS
jgi:hypothetical protein